MKLLGGQQREAIGKVETHLGTEQRSRPCPGAIHLIDPMIEYLRHEREVRLHSANLAAALLAAKGRRVEGVFLSVLEVITGKLERRGPIAPYWSVFQWTAIFRRLLTYV